MDLQGDIVIGLDVGATRIVAAAFDLSGRELAAVSARIMVAATELGGRTQEPGASWQALVHALTTLAARMPRLAERTIGLGITGTPEGTWVIDDDGDPIVLAAIGADRHTATIVAQWRADGMAAEVERITGAPLSPAGQVARLAAIQREQPGLLDQAALVLHPKDWIHFCATGVVATEATQAMVWGMRTTDAGAPSLLSLLGLDEVMPLLPPILAATAPARLTAGAAAALGLGTGTPVVLGPVDLVAAAIAMGAGGGRNDHQGDVALTWLADRRMHMVASSAATPSASPTDGVATVGLDGFDLELRAIAAPTNPDCDWVIGLAEQLLADAGLIGIGRGELAAILERKACAAPPGALLLRPEADPGCAPGGKQVLGMSQATTLYDLLRAVHESAGLEARASYATLGCCPSEVRLAAEGDAGAFAQSILAACTGVPLRTLHRRHAAATGAALLATAALTEIGDLDALRDGWVEAHLDPPQPPDPELSSCYDRLYARYRGAPSDRAGAAVHR